VYPYAGQTGVEPLFNNAGEIPNPAPDLNGVGHPIGLSFATQKNGTPVVVINQLTLAPQGGSPVTIRILGNSKTSGGTGVTVLPDSTGEMGNGFIAVLPVAVLNSATTYTVVFSGTADGAAVAKTWSFTTSN